MKTRISVQMHPDVPEVRLCVDVSDPDNPGKQAHARIDMPESALDLPLDEFVRLYGTPAFNAIQQRLNPGKQVNARFDIPESALELPLEDFVRVYGTPAFDAILKRLKARK